VAPQRACRETFGRREAHSEIALVLLAMVDQILSRVLRSQGTASRLISAVRSLKHGHSKAPLSDLLHHQSAPSSAPTAYSTALLAASSVRPRAPAPQRARGRGWRTSPRCRGGSTQPSDAVLGLLVAPAGSVEKNPGCVKGDLNELLFSRRARRRVFTTPRPEPDLGPRA
jgi:hypothetical protein